MNSRVVHINHGPNVVDPESGSILCGLNSNDLEVVDIVFIEQGCRNLTCTCSSASFDRGRRCHLRSSWRKWTKAESCSRAQRSRSTPPFTRKSTSACRGDARFDKFKRYSLFTSLHLIQSGSKEALILWFPNYEDVVRSYRQSRPKGALLSIALAPMHSPSNKVKEQC
jgi:hypothetical protein